MGSSVVMIIIVAAMVGVLFLTGIRPQQKKNKERQAMFNDMKPGDFVLTNSGFYGELVDVQEETVIVEFGNNKNCRIAMKRDCIEQVEKASSFSTSIDMADKAAENTEEKKKEREKEEKKAAKEEERKKKEEEKKAAKEEKKG